MGEDEQAIGVAIYIDRLTVGTVSTNSIGVSVEKQCHRQRNYMYTLGMTLFLRRKWCKMRFDYNYKILGDVIVVQDHNVHFSLPQIFCTFGGC